MKESIFFLIQNGYTHDNDNDDDDEMSHKKEQRRTPPPLAMNLN